MLSVDNCHGTYIKQSPLFDDFLVIVSGLRNEMFKNRFFHTVVRVSGVRFLLHKIGIPFHIYA